MACDAGLVVLQHGAGGEILDVGRRTRNRPERPAPCPAVPGPQPVPVPGRRLAPLRCSPRRALGGRRRDPVAQPRQSLPVSSPRGSMSLFMLIPRCRAISFSRPCVSSGRRTASTCRSSTRGKSRVHCPYQSKRGVQLLDHVGVVEHALARPGHRPGYGCGCLTPEKAAVSRCGRPRFGGNRPTSMNVYSNVFHPSVTWRGVQVGRPLYSSTGTISGGLSSTLRDRRRSSDSNVA